MDEDEFSTTIEALRQENARLSQQNEELRRLASFPRLNPNPVLEFDRLGKVIFHNPAAGEVLSRLGLADARPFIPDDFASMSISANESLVLPSFREMKIEDHYFGEAIHYSPEYDSFRIYANDITDQVKTRESLRQSEERYRSLFEGMTEGFAIHEIILDENGKPCDYRFVDINPAFERLTGLKREMVIGKTYRQVLPDEGDSWVNVYGNVVLTGEPVQFENYSSSLNRYYEVFAYRCAIDQFAVIFLDITDLKKMEDDLRINLAKYSTLFELLPLGVTVSDQNGQILESNREAMRLLGLSEEEQKSRQIGSEGWEIIRTDGTPMPPEEFASVRAMKENRRIENVEMGLVKGDEQITWISVTAAPLPLEGYGVVIAYNDVSRRVQAEEMLRNAYVGLEHRVRERTQELFNTNQELTAEIEVRKRIESQLVIQTKAVESERQRFNDVLEILPAYLILLTPDYHVSFANRYFRERFGEDQGRRCYEYLFGRSEPCENCETYTVLKTGKPHRWEWTGPDSRNYDVYDFPFADADGSNLILEMGIDITQRKQAEEKLRLLNVYNRSLIEANLDALITITPDGKIGDVNSVTEAITGLTREELIGTEFHSYFTDPQKARAGYQQVFEIGSVRDFELEIQRKDGHTTPVIYNASIYHDESGHVTGVFAAARDITERKQAERQLVLLTTALEAAANGIIVTDVNGSILWSNPAFSRMTGFAHEEIIGQNPRLLKSNQQDLAYYQGLWNTILTGEVWHGELINRRKDGTLYYEEQTITPVIDRENKITNFISIKQDITDHKLAEQQLERQNRELLALSQAEHRLRGLAEGLVESVKALSSSLRLEDVLSTILDQIRRTVPFRGADIVLIEGNTFRVAGFRGFEDLPDSVAALERSYTLDDFPLLQRLCATLQPVLVPNTLEEPDWRLAAGMDWVRSFLAVPLISGGQVIGILNLSSDQPDFFDLETCERLTAFADHAALALHNAQIYKAEQTARQVAETLRTAAQALTQTLDLDEIFDTLLEHVGALIHPDMAGTALLEGETRLVIRSIRSLARPVDADQASLGVVDTDSLPLLKKLLSGHESLLIHDTATIPGSQLPSWADGLRTWLGIPLVASDKVIGIIGLGRIEKDSFTPEQVQWAEALVGQAAMAIQNAWLFQQVRASSERLQGLSRRLVEVQENERRYIASELHDEVGQALTTLMVQLQLIESRAEQPEAVRAEVAAMGQVLDAVIENLHRLAMDLRPASLDYLGLEAALRQHVDLMSTKLGLEIQFAMIGITERLPASIEIAFYRIVQEALNNVVRHSHAKHADVLITRREGCLVVIIEDDGVGFNPEEAFKGKRIGLDGMRERAEMLGGKLLVESVPGQGSTILVEVPYASPNSYRR